MSLHFQKSQSLSLPGVGSKREDLEAAHLAAEAARSNDQSHNQATATPVEKAKSLAIFSDVIDEVHQPPKVQKSSSARQVSS